MIEDDEWEIKARAHIDKLEAEYPDKSKWLPSVQWLSAALDELDSSRTEFWKATNTTHL